MTSISASVSGFGRQKPVSVGSIVAVERGRGRVDIARVAGVSSDGNTVDISVMKEYVKEMYVDAGEPTTYERLEDVREVRSEFAPSQDGWIVLEQDISAVKQEFEARASSNEKKSTTVIITSEEKRPIDDAAFRRQSAFPKPTKLQALFGAALSVPIAAMLYAVYSGAKNAYEGSSVNDEASAAALRQIALLSASTGTVVVLVAGAGLLLYALSGAAED